MVFGVAGFGGWPEAQQRYQDFMQSRPFAWRNYAVWHMHALDFPKGCWQVYTTRVVFVCVYFRTCMLILADEKPLDDHDFVLVVQSLHTAFHNKQMEILMKANSIWLRCALSIAKRIWFFVVAFAADQIKFALLSLSESTQSKRLFAVRCAHLYNNHHVFVDVFMFLCVLNHPNGLNRFTPKLHALYAKASCCCAMVSMAVFGAAPNFHSVTLKEGWPSARRK